MSADEVGAYDAELVARLRAVLGHALVGVYVSGSAALGDYVPGKSDLDRFAVVERALDRATKDAVVAATRHEALPCPARGLELVVYTRAAARLARGVDFELNLNSGRAMPFHATFDPADEPAHWFVLDRAIVGERGWALTGPPPREVFAAVPRAVALAALRESLAWHAENPEEAGENAVLNAARALRFAERGDWVSKAEAAAWARGHVDDPGVIDAALAARERGSTQRLDRAAASRLLEAVSHRLPQPA